MNTSTPKLLLLDAMALLYRAHFALLKQPRQNAAGLRTGCLLGFTNSLAEVLRRFAPTHVAVALDSPGPTFRAAQYPLYKAHRDGQPEAITAALPYLHELLAAFRIPAVALHSYEADDLMGTLAKQASACGWTSYLVTPDKDLAQLVDPHTYLYKPALGIRPGILLDVAAVNEQWGITTPDQVRDILGLWGDSSDNIPGVPGIGAKRAQALIATHHSLEGVLEALPTLQGKIAAQLQEHAAQARLSKELATICCNAPLALTLEETRYQGPDETKLHAILHTLGFRGLAARLLGHPTAGTQTSLFATPPAKGGSTTPPLPLQGKRLGDDPYTYHTLTTLGEVATLHKAMEGVTCFAWDCETTGLDPLCDRLLGISIAWEPHHAYYLSLPSQEEARQHFLEALRQLLEDPATTKVGHNLKFDIRVMMAQGITPQGPCFDTMIAHHLLAPDARHSLDTLAQAYLDYTPIPITDLIGPKGKEQGKMEEVPLEQLAPYACEDADVTLRLYQQLAPTLEARGFAKLFYHLEMPVLPVLATMEHTGVALDHAALQAYGTTLAKELAQLTTQVHQAAGNPFNLASPKQLGQVLFEHLALLPNPPRTKTGQYATSEAVLAKHAHLHPIIGHVRRYRALQKLKNTYVDALPTYCSPHDSRIHTTYHQGIVSTGRLSAAHPNLQNIPIRTQEGKPIRAAFIAEASDHLLLAADYSQIELRIMAHFAQDPTMLQAFAAGKDIHLLTAAHVFGIAEAQVTPEQRRQAKMVNFGIIYGISPFGLAERLGIPRSTATQIINAYFAEFPKVKAYMEHAIEQARQQGYATTLMGRQRPLPDIHSRNAAVRGFAERNAINMPIQGTQAELIKQAMVDLHAWLQAHPGHGKLIMQVHDELVLEVPEETVAVVQQAVVRLMEGALPLSLPLTVDVGIGRSWLDTR